MRAQARQVADAALKPVTAMAKAVDEAARQTNATFGAEAGRTQSPALALTNMFMWPWLGAMQSAQQNGSTKARGVSGMEEVIPLGEEVLEVGKRTENRGTARIRRFVVETPDRAAGHAAEREGGGGAPSASERQGHRRDPDRGHGGNR